MWALYQPIPLDLRCAIPIQDTSDQFPVRISFVSDTYMHFVKIPITILGQTYYVNNYIIHPNRRYELIKWEWGNPVVVKEIMVKEKDFPLYITVGLDVIRDKPIHNPPQGVKVERLYKSSGKRIEAIRIAYKDGEFISEVK